jgi:peptidoglycan/xylan/chitin deacetylase (PgdA/CDA1 family)
MNYVSTYAAVKQHHSITVRDRARSAALDVMALLGSDSVMSRPRVHFLYIHHIFEDELPALERLLDYLQEHFSIISHTEAANRVLHDQIDKPYLSISSDDGFKNNLAAGEALARRDLSACFFINPALIGEADFNTVKAHCADQLHFPPVEFLTWRDVEQLQTMGHEIGSHTMKHMRVSRFSDAQIQEDVGRTHDILMARCGTAEHFAWPYGRFSDFSESGRRIVFDTGFSTCSSAVRGAHVAGGVSDPRKLCIRRDHILLAWKLNHIKVFLRRAAKSAAPQNDLYPYAQ